MKPIEETQASKYCLTATTEPVSSSSSSPPLTSPKSVTEIRSLVLNVFRDIIDGMFSVIEEYEDDPEWNEAIQGEEHPVDEAEEAMEEEE